MNLDYEEDPINDPEEEKKYTKRLFKKLIIRFIITILIVGVFYYLEAWIRNDFNKLPEYSTESYIHYANGEKMPTLYSCTRYKSVIDSKYRFEDSRFGDRVTTIEITYEPSPEDMIDKYEAFIITQNYEYLDYYGEETELFVKNVKNEDNEKYKEYAAFIIVKGHTKTIYGVLEGTYDRIFY